MADAQERLGPAEIREARARVARIARITPLIPSEALATRLGHPVSFKCENLQIGGAFKIRGASNFLAELDPAVAARGVITYSSGNHAIALSIAARSAGLPVVVVMPDDAPAVKVERARENGAEVHFRGTTSAERKTLAEELQKKRGLTMVPPFDHPAIIAGQASCGVEILEQMPDVGVVLVPVGGGGLLSGIALACGYRRAAIRVIGVEPEGAACMTASLRAGAPVTLSSVGSVADGLLPVRPGDLNFDIVRRFVMDVITVPDEAIREAAGWLLRSEHLLAEWSGATALAALRSGRVRTGGVPTAVVLSGGNIDPRALLETPPAEPPQD
ncbi:MAG: threonine/serine dehydratase [Acidobacteriota bacterium]